MNGDPDLSGSELFWSAIKALLAGTIVLITIITVSLVVGSAMRDANTKRTEELLERLDSRLVEQYQRASDDRLDIRARLERVEKAITK